MYRLLKIDFRKYFYSRTFWILSIVYLTLMVLVFFGIEKFLNTFMHNASKNAAIPIPNFSLYSFPYVWQNMAYLAGFFKIFPALIILIYVTNEFNYKTIRQNVMNGLSREQFLLSKVIFVFLYSAIATLVLFLSALILGLIHSTGYQGNIFQHAGFSLAYFLEVFTFSILGLMIGFLLKRSGLAIGTLILYYYIIEPVISFKISGKISSFFPVKSMSNLIDVPNSSLMKLFGMNFRDYVATQDVVMCIIYSFLFIGIVWLHLKHSDL